MRPFLLASLLLLASASARAGTLNLRWNACFVDGGVANRNFACNTNSGSQALVGSFVLPHDMVSVTGNEIVIDVGTAGATLASWWQFKNAGACRMNSLSLNFVVPPAAVQCVDWAGGAAVGALLSYTPGLPTPVSARLRVASAIQTPYVDLAANTEFFSFTLVINNLKTVGAGSCDGCSVGACIALKGVNVTSSDSRENTQVVPGGAGLGFVDALATWQGGAGVITGNDCPAATPTRNQTWGGLKSLYR